MEKGLQKLPMPHSGAVEEGKIMTKKTLKTFSLLSSLLLLTVP